MIVAPFGQKDPEPTESKDRILIWCKLDDGLWHVVAAFDADWASFKAATVLRDDVCNIHVQLKPKDGIESVVIIGKLCQQDR